MQQNQNFLEIQVWGCTDVNATPPLGPTDLGEPWLISTGDGQSYPSIVDIFSGRDNYCIGQCSYSASMSPSPSPTPSPTPSPMPALPSLKTCTCNQGASQTWILPPMNSVGLVQSSMDPSQCWTLVGPPRILCDGVCLSLGPCTSLYAAVFNRTQPITQIPGASTFYLISANPNEDWWKELSFAVQENTAAHYAQVWPSSDSGKSVGEDWVTSGPDDGATLQNDFDILNDPTPRCLDAQPCAVSPSPTPSPTRSRIPSNSPTPSTKPVYSPPTKTLSPASAAGISFLVIFSVAGVGLWVWVSFFGGGVLFFPFLAKVANFFRLPVNGFGGSSSFPQAGSYKSVGLSQETAKARLEPSNRFAAGERTSLL